MSSPTPPKSPPFSLPTVVDPWIESSLVQDILNNDLAPLDQAIKNALGANIPQITNWNITTSKQFLLFASRVMNWQPTEICNGKMIYWTLCLFYFILDQAPLGGQQTQISPSSYGKISPLSNWVVSFAKKVGEYMDSPNSISAASVETFKKSPLYNYDEALEPVDGFPTFNQLFSRRLQQGMRPISCPDDDSVVVYPADSTFNSAEPIDSSSNVKIKGLEWPIRDLLAGSQYADQFAGGHFMHAFLNTFDYHRQHAPVSGTVVEANVIQGLAYLNVLADKDGILKPHRGLVPTDNTGKTSLDAPDNAGYQFLQTRGCVIIKNPLLGYVAVLPIGMAQVSSVKLVWEPAPGQSYPINPNVQINKGDEISNFLFGGSDIVLVFQKGANLKILGATGVDALGHATQKQKYLVGMPLGVSSNTSS